MLATHQRFLWLDLVERGCTTATIAARWKVSRVSVELAIEEARAQVAAFVEARRLMTPPPLYLTFPIAGLFPSSTCPHDRVPMPDGSLGCCAVCHQSGRENHPVLDRFPAFEPKPDPVPVAEAEPLTRKQKRAARHAKVTAA